MNNIDDKEIENFDAIAGQWWEKQGVFKTLHDINPLRLHFIQQAVPVAKQKIIDVGCGGGILAESLAREGAEVMGIDASAPAIQAAQQHAAQSASLTLEYAQISVEEIAATHAAQYDILTCMELLEHVPNPMQLIDACGQLVKPGGHLFFSTINRNLKAYLFAIVGAEYILKLLPKGIHHYEKFIRPAEFSAWARAAKLQIMAIRGLSYNPLTQHYKLGANIDVNYLVHCQKIA